VRQGRLLHRRWAEYNGAHVVSRPLRMTPEELEVMFRRLWREFYRPLTGGEVVEKLEPDTSDPHMRERRRKVGLGE
jgi:hypothetical protein